jgi:hypothetical protein
MTTADGGDDATSEMLLEAPAGAMPPLDIKSSESKSIDKSDTWVTQVKLQIIDANTGTNLTAQTNTVIVGQQMNLLCQLNVGVPTNWVFTNFSWTVPGYAISNYVVAGDGSSAMVVTNFPLNNSNVVFYWVDGASNRTVQVSATIDGKTVTGQAMFNIYRPSVTFTDEPPSWATNVTVEGTFSLSLGDGNGHGSMKYEPDISSQFSGKADITQLINRSANNGNTSDSTSGQYWLDNYVFNIVASNDPNIPHNVRANVVDPILKFDDGPCFALAHFYGNTTSIVDYFKDYVMFRPDNGNAANNIYVPLGKLTWSWSASTTYSDGTWSMPTFSITRPITPDVGCEFPQWLHPYTN